MQAITDLKVCYEGPGSPRRRGTHVEVPKGVLGAAVVEEDLLESSPSDTEVFAV